jgi:hypothetical protein
MLSLDLNKLIDELYFEHFFPVVTFPFAVKYGNQMIGNIIYREV